MSHKKYFDLNLQNSAKWQDYLNRLDENTRDIYFSPGYYKLYEELGDGIAKCFVFEDAKNIAIYPFLLNPINKQEYNLADTYFDIQGAYGYNGVIYSSLEPGFIGSFYEAFVIYCAENNIIAEFTRFHPLLKNQNFSENNMQVVYDRSTVFIDLSDTAESIWKNQYSSKNRNMIRKAEKMGCTIDIIAEPSLLHLKSFIEIYYLSMEKANANKYYYFNEEYFFNTFKYLKSSAYLFNVKDTSGETVCSSIFYKYGSYFHYHLSGRSENADNTVNNFLINEAVKFAKDNNAKFIHLGGGRSNAPDDTLLKFKSGFSKKSSSFLIGKKVYNQPVYNLIEQQWNEKNGLLKDKYKNHLLKYRITTSK